MNANSVERTVDGRLKLFVARHGHGTYPKVCAKPCQLPDPGDKVEAALLEVPLQNESSGQICILGCD